jgi:hypothetical protein
MASGVIPTISTDRAIAYSIVNNAGWANSVRFRLFASGSSAHRPAAKHLLQVDTLGLATCAAQLRLSG